VTDARPPFHLSFFVLDLDATRRFYGGVLGCREGRSAPTWVDFDFFGHQLSMHTTGRPVPTENKGIVDGLAVPVPHFGAILRWEEFQSLAGRLREAGHPFVVEPMIRFEGRPSEQATMFVLDPSGNALEFKTFRRPDRMFDA